MGCTFGFEVKRKGNRESGGFGHLGKKNNKLWRWGTKFGKGEKKKGEEADDE